MSNSSRTQGVFRHRWWRFTAYEVSGDYIRPADGAELEAYTLASAHAGESPYVELGRIVEQVPAEEDCVPLRDLTAEERTLVGRWCQRYGLLGILPHTSRSVVFAPRQRNVSLGGVDVPFAFQTRLIQSGGSWRHGHSLRLEVPPGASVAELDAIITTLDEALLPRETDLEVNGEGFDSPSAVTTDLAEIGLRVHGFEQVWKPFFPKVPAGAGRTQLYPLPGTQDFWTAYAEPVQMFVRWAIGITRCVTALSARKRLTTNPWLTRLFDSLLAPAGVALEGAGRGTRRLEVCAPSLASALTVMAVDEAGEGLLTRHCAACRRLYQSKKPNVKYCTTTCRKRVEMRQYRKRRRRASRSEGA